MAINFGDIFQNILQRGSEIGLSWLESKVGSSSKTSAPYTQPPAQVYSQTSFKFEYIILGVFALLILIVIKK